MGYFSTDVCPLTLEQIGDRNPKHFCMPSQAEAKMAERYFRQELARRNAQGKGTPEQRLMEAVQAVFAAGRLFERQCNNKTTTTT